MKLNLTVDDTKHVINVNANLPLNKIIQGIDQNFQVNNSCLGGNCGNCVVLLNGQCVLSCMVPAFRLNKAVIYTYTGFKKTRMYQDIEKAYNNIQIRPCEQCIASKTLLIEGILNKIEQSQETVVISSRNTNTGNKSTADHNFIVKEMSINSCSCVEMSQLEKIINLAYTYRRRRSNGRS